MSLMVKKSLPPEGNKVLLKNKLFSGPTPQVKALFHKIGFGWYNTVFFLQLLGSRRFLFFSIPSKQHFICNVFDPEINL